MLSYSTLSKHPFDFLYPQSTKVLSLPYGSNIFDAMLLSALLSTRLQDWRWFDIILIAPEYISKIEHIRFSNPPQQLD